jgi:hypothetical protein
MSNRKSKYTDFFSTGQIIGRWKIVSPDIIVEREAMVECECECGNRKWISAYTLVKGTSTGCKVCQNKSYTKANNPNWKGGNIIPGYIIYRIKSGAEKRNIQHNLSIEYLERLYIKQNGLCALSKHPIYFGQCKYNSTSTASLDRIDSTGGYTEGNVQWIHKDVNIMKNGFSFDYFIKMCRTISENTKHFNINENATAGFVFGR